MAMNWMSSSRFLRRALARSSLIEMPGVSSMKSLDGGGFHGGALDALEVALVRRVAARELAHGELRAGENEALHELEGAHFAGKHHARLAQIDADVLDDVHHERGLAHRWTGGDDEHFTRFQAAAHAVEFLESGGDPLRALFPGEQRLELLQHLLDGLFDRGSLVGLRTLADGQDLRLHRVQQRGHLIRRVVGLGDRLVGILDDRTQDELVLHVLQVMAEMPGTRRVGVKIRQRRRPADPIQQSAVEQALHQRNQLHLLPALEHADQKIIQGRVRRQVEMLLA